MTEMQTLLDRVYGNLSKIPVSGENCALMALALQDLRAAYKITTELEEETRDG